MSLYYGEAGLVKRCRQVRDYVASLSLMASDSHIHLPLKKAIQKLSNYRVPRKVTKLSVLPDATKDKEISSSERSFGSMLKIGKDVLLHVTTIGGYSPSNSDISVANLGVLLQKVDDKNGEVTVRLAEYREAVAVRMNYYRQMDLKVKQIKLAIAGQYEKTSFQYKEVVKIGY